MICTYWCNGTNSSRNITLAAFLIESCDSPYFEFDVTILTQGVEALPRLKLITLDYGESRTPYSVVIMQRLPRILWLCVLGTTK